jgi:hypothetical protein
VAAELVHDPQAGEGIGAVVDRAAVGPAQVLLDELARQRRAAADDRQRHPLLPQDGHVLLHHRRALDQQAADADGVRVVPARGRQDRVDRLLDPEVERLVPVVRQDDVDQVLADVVDVPLDRRQDDAALLGPLDPLHVRLEVRDGGLHDLGRLRTNGSCIFPEPNSSPTTFIPSSRTVLMMSSGAYDRRASSRSSIRLERSAWMIAFLSRSSTAAAFCFLAAPPFWTVLS